MQVFPWAWRALIRAPLRSGLLVGVLGVSIGLALIMITVNGAFAERVDEIRSQVGTDITVRPAGTFGGGFIVFGGGGGPGGPVTEEGGESDAQDGQTQQTLTDEEIAVLADIDNVESYSRRVSAQYSGDSLESSIEPPEGIELPEGAAFGGPPIGVTGTDDASRLTSFGEDADLVEGRSFEAGEVDADVVVIGQSLAEKNDLSLGDSIDLEGIPVEVIGIYTTGTQFGDNQMALPLDTARRIFERGTEIDELTVRADTAGNVGAVAKAIRETLGEDKADVTSQEAQFDAISGPVSDAQDSSRIAMYAALIASAAVILFSVGIVARQRIKEIGILKAVGASNWHVVGQMTLETAGVAVVAAVIGALATFPLAQSVADGLVSDTQAAGTGPQIFGGPGGPGGGGPTFDVAPIGQGAAAQGSGVLGDVDVAVSPEIFGYALAIAIGLALFATLIPAWYVGRVKPAEVLRYE